MKNKIWSALKKTGKGLLFVLIFLALGGLIMNVMVFKQEDGTLPVHNYYSLPKDTVDVLVLGTSHAGMNVSTKTMWDEYGIAGYRYWGSVQPIWNTYYYLLDALKYQTPKVVILDAYSVTFEQEYGSYPVQVKNTIAMRLSKEKIENIWASVPEENRGFMLLGFPTYHNRYNELTEEDFEYFPWDSHNGIQVYSSETSDRIYAFSILDKDATEGEASLGEKEEKYFRMLLQYCKDNKIPLELIVCPYEISYIEQQKYRRVAAIAEEYGFDFTNYNETYQEYGINPQQDFLDPAHLNKNGLPKYARALAEMLKSKYDLPDRRKDSGHIWNQVRTEVNGPVFALTEQFQADGRQDYADTGMKLYENPYDSWTLCADFSLPAAGSESRTVMACFNDANNSGLRVSRGTNGNLEISYGADMTARIQNPAEEIRLCVIKMGQTTKIYVNDELIEDRRLDQDSLAQYDGTLLLGCEVSDTGRRMHFGKTLIRDLVIYDTALNENDALGWKPKELPLREKTEYLRAVTEEDLILSLGSRFTGDGDKFINTGEKLYEDPEASFTVLCQLEAAGDEGDRVYFSCFSEKEGEYHGLLVRKTGPETLNIVYGAASGLNLTIPAEGPVRLAVVKDRSAYTVYLNGEKVLDGDVSVCDAYNGPFLIGAQTDAAGDIFRKSRTTVYNLEVYRGLMPEESILGWQPEPLAEAPGDPGTDVTYTMPESFAGNGKDACVDTGIQLYDNAGKDWTITVALEQVTVREGSVLSCFDETPGQYRGLLLRQASETVFSFVTGTEYTEIEIDPADRVILTITKEGDRYRIYADGEKKAEKESRIGSYLGNLYIGCERNQYGQPFRFSDIRARRLEIVPAAMTDAEARQQYESWRDEMK